MYLCFYIFIHLCYPAFSFYIRKGNKIMVRIITIAQKKGGATKTTTTMNLAGALLEKGYSVKIGDMNTEQQSAMKWAHRGDEFKPIVFLMPDKQVKQEIKKLTGAVDFLLIDTPPELMLATVKAAVLSDLIIIPCQASTLDLEAAEETIELPETTEKPFYMLASCIKKGTTIGNQLPDTLRRLGQTFNTIIHNRVSIVEAAMVGKWIGSYKPNSEEHTEFKNLASEVINIMEGMGNE